MKLNSTEKSRTEIVRQLVAGKITFGQAQNKLGTARSTLYKWKTKVKDGKTLVDKRRFGNRRMYGAK